VLIVHERYLAISGRSAAISALQEVGKKRAPLSQRNYKGGLLGIIRDTPQLWVRDTPFPVLWYFDPGEGAGGDSGAAAMAVGGQGFGEWFRGAS
jgi:hypothetical protein